MNQWTDSFMVHAIVIFIVLLEHDDHIMGTQPLLVHDRSHTRGDAEAFENVLDGHIIVIAVSIDCIDASGRVPAPAILFNVPVVGELALRSFSNG